MKRYNYILTIAAMLCAVNAQAQINLRPGYIITNENDTIRGNIDFRTAERNAHTCDFFPTDINSKKSYQPGDIYAYRFTDDGKFYVTRTVTIDDTKQKLFLEYLVKGVVSLYYYKDASTHFFFENEEGQMVEAVEETKEVTSEHGTTGIRTQKKYIGVMKWMFQKSDKVMKKIPRLSLSKDELSKITKEYHYDTCETGEQCIEFENKTDKHFFKLQYTASAGVRIHSLDSNVSTQYWSIGSMKSISPSVAFGVNVTIPRIGQILGLQAEVEFSRLACEKDAFASKSTYYKLDIDATVSDVRLGLRLKPFKGKVYPVIEGGGCYTHLWGLSATLYAQRLLAAQFYTDELDASKYINKNYYSYYASAGIVFNLSKNSLIVQGLYQQSVGADNKLSTIGGSIGLTF